MVLLVAATILAFAAGIIGSAIGVFVPDGAPAPSPTVAMRPLPVEQNVGLDTHRGGHPQPPPPPKVKFVCGAGEGSTVDIVGCRTSRDVLFGWAEASEPHGAHADCVEGWTAYSRGPDYWVCWTDIAGGADVHRWATTEDPFPQRKDANDGDR